ncbi:LuxR family transcriptional regulator [Actinoplanes sp. SE50]|uniref:response regulator n=1 Tax=unclassified Actinoplanes TaxID=2626549 RepID=UPI00023EBB48|nr:MULTISPECIES: response regulator transcription factor [unclassified Actinoplanes]AEV83408.1 Transcriptional regulatory protein degU [Actinoplanes sp. SE50/110]ATO81801.1 LuxR family transcriptional regulator [Actinoplanes sp. SE50]SLL99209.1 LuxR-family two component system response regulator [Actinoplanes sp. SE50/110]
MTVRVLIVDDQALVRVGFRMIIEARDDLQVVGEAGDGEQALRLAAQTRPDVVLMDVRMPGMDGLAATARLTALPDAPRVIMLTTYDLDESLYAALRAGASGFLLKDVRPGDLAEAIRVVARGEALLAPTATRRLLDRFVAADMTPPGADVRLDRLTAREREVLELLGRGASNAEIATRLTVTEATVKTHVSAVLRKLDVRDRVQAVVLAYDLGVVRPRSS